MNQTTKLQQKKSISSFLTLFINTFQKNHPIGVKNAHARKVLSKLILLTRLTAFF
jgi:hypothetical protein